jgi:hypothetical protein
MSNEKNLQNLTNGKDMKSLLKENSFLILSALSLILLFFPMFSIKSDYSNISVSGFSALFGSGSSAGTFVAIFLFVFPIALIASYFIKPLQNFKNIISIISPVGGIISLFIVYGFVSSASSSGGIVEISTGMDIGFWLILLIDIATTALAVIKYMNIPVSDYLKNIKK